MANQRFACTGGISDSTMYYTFASHMLKEQQVLWHVRKQSFLNIANNKSNIGIILLFCYNK